MKRILYFYIILICALLPFSATAQKSNDNGKRNSTVSTETGKKIKKAFSSINQNSNNSSNSSSSNSLDTNPNRKRPTGVLPKDFRNLWDNHRVLEARLYSYNHYNFQLPAYGVRMTIEYGGRTTSNTPDNIDCYFMGSNDDAIVVIGPAFTMPFVFRESNNDYDVFEIYKPTPNDDYYNELHIGKGKNQNKIIILGKEKADSGKYRNFRAEYSTSQNGNTQSSNNSGGGNVLITPDYGNGGRSYGNSLSSKITCSRCGGSGICKSCGGSGGRVEYVDGYTGSGRRSFINCGECHGAKNCPICHGRGHL